MIPALAFKLLRKIARGRTPPPPPTTHTHTHKWRVEVSHVNAIAVRALTPRKLCHAISGRIDCFMTLSKLRAVPVGLWQADVIPGEQRPL